jgi:hypothetical protein
MLLVRLQAVPRPSLVLLPIPSQPLATQELLDWSVLSASLPPTLQARHKQRPEFQSKVRILQLWTVPRKPPVPLVLL